MEMKFPTLRGIKMACCKLLKFKNYEVVYFVGIPYTQITHVMLCFMAKRIGKRIQLFSEISSTKRNNIKKL